MKQQNIKTLCLIYVYPSIKCYGVRKATKQIQQQLTKNGKNENEKNINKKKMYYVIRFVYGMKPKIDFHIYINEGKLHFMCIFCIPKCDPQTPIYTMCMCRIHTYCILCKYCWANFHFVGNDMSNSH